MEWNHSAVLFRARRHQEFKYSRRFGDEKEFTVYTSSGNPPWAGFSRERLEECHCLG